ncbi:MAG: hypothetical protein AB1725_04250, partial [Armatimonadota bacterium]
MEENDVRPRGDKKVGRRALHAVKVVLKILKAIVTVSAALTILTHAYFETFGKRWRLEASLHELIPGVQIGFFEDRLGSAAFKRASGEKTEY